MPTLPNPPTPQATTPSDAPLGAQPTADTSPPLLGLLRPLSLIRTPGTNPRWQRLHAEQAAREAAEQAAEQAAREAAEQAAREAAEQAAREAEMSEPVSAVAGDPDPAVAPFIWSKLKLPALDDEAGIDNDDQMTPGSATDTTRSDTQQVPRRGTPPMPPQPPVAARAEAPSEPQPARPAPPSARTDSPLPGADAIPTAPAADHPTGPGPMLPSPVRPAASAPPAPDSAARRAVIPAAPAVEAATDAAQPIPGPLERPVDPIPAHAVPADEADNLDEADNVGEQEAAAPIVTSADGPPLPDLATSDMAPTVEGVDHPPAAGAPTPRRPPDLRIAAPLATASTIARTAHDTADMLGIPDAPDTDPAGAEAVAAETEPAHLAGHDGHLPDLLAEPEPAQAARQPDAAAIRLWFDAEEQAAEEPAPSVRTEVQPLELRQIAGLTAGASMTLDHAGYEFAEGDGLAAFSIAIDEHERAMILPGSAPAKLDTVPVEEPTLVGRSALDVGSARFLVRPRRVRYRAADWLDGPDPFTEPEMVIIVPDLRSDGPAAESGGTRRRFARKRDDAPTDGGGSLGGPALELIDRIQTVRAELADRERHLHPDPAELADRIAQRAPILRVRAPGHPLFAKVNVICADMPWLPAFDDIKAIPDSLGIRLQPLMSLPSIPITADLLVGPLGIVGSRVASTACARHIVASLYALSTADLRIHVATSPDRARLWDWCRDLRSDDDIEPGVGFPVVVVDGMENFGRLGLDHAAAMEGRVGVVILADSIDELPAYSGTVLQVDLAGSGLLTNHLGHVIAGTPVGITSHVAQQMAEGLTAAGSARV